MVLLTASTAPAGGLKRTLEVIDPRIEGKIDWLGPDRYIRVARGGESGPNGLVARLDTIYDFTTRSFLTVRIPMAELDRRFNERYLVPEAVHYDGRNYSFWVEAGGSIYASRLDVTAGTFADFVKLGEKGPKRYFKPIGIDTAGEFFYYGFLRGEGEGPDLVSPSIDLGRVDLKSGKVDWTFEFRPPSRERPLNLLSFHLDHRGKQLAAIEYNDSAHDKKRPIKKKQQAYVFDIATKTYKSLPIPRTPYGVTFGRDDASLFVGSWEEQSIVKLDLVTGKVAGSVKTSGHVDNLDTAPSGKSLLVFFSVSQSDQEVFEVRRASDLKVTFTAPVRMLSPDRDSSGEGQRTRDGKTWLNHVYDKDKKLKGIRLYDVPDDFDAVGGSGSDAELRIARGIVTAKRYATAQGIEIPGKEEELGDPSKRFATILVTPKGDIYLTGTEGNGARPVVARLTEKGVARWKRNLSKPGFKEHVGARLAVMDDGRVVAHVFSYVVPGSWPVSRLVMLAPTTGKPIWEYQFRGTGGLNNPLPDEYDVRPDGAITLRGRIYRKENVVEHWSGVISPDGKVLDDKVGD